MWGVEICKIYSKIMKKYHHCVKFTYPLSFQTRIPKVDQHTGGKWLIHGTKHRKDNQLQNIYSIQMFLNKYYTQSRLLFLVSLPQMEMCITIIQGKLTSFILSLPSDHRDQEHQDTLVQISTTSLTVWIITVLIENANKTVKEHILENDIKFTWIWNKQC